MHVQRHESPVGVLTLSSDGHALVGCHFEDEVAALEPGGGRCAVLDEARRQLDAWFSGRRRVFTVPVAARGTPFRQRVWAALWEIPFGATWSYAQLARQLGQPTAVRAVGAANGANPLPLFIPCHRVIGADGALTGYSGGLERKQWLLAHEGARVS